MIQKLFAKIVDKKTGQLIVGTGTNSEFYKSLGMTLMDVEQHKDGNWYIPGSEDDIKYNLLEQLADYQRLLSSTDWYVSRFTETGKAIPEDIKLKRAEAREIISNLKKQLEEGNK